jgi:hypothetical protein
MVPLVIDLYCGLGGWTKGFLAEGYDAIGFDMLPDGVKVPSSEGRRTDVGNGVPFTSRDCGIEGVKGMSGLHGFSHPDGNGGRDLGGPNDPRRFNSRSSARKAASAQIAEIPFDLAQWIARCFLPVGCAEGIGHSDADSK